MTHPPSASDSAAVVSADSPPIPAYELHDDLAQFCLPDTNRDSYRHIAWVDSICLVFLLIAAIGLNPPKLEITAVTPAEELVPVLTELPPPQAPVQAETQPEEIDSNQENVETPQVVTIVAADPSAVAFAVPVVGATALAPAHLASAPPANPMQKRPPAPAPAAPPVVTLQTTGKGGDFPEPPYPEVAIRRGIQGTVVIYIEVDAQGTITKAEVKETSGYSILDEHCVNWVKKKYVFPPGEIRKHRCPFIFKLN